jgi:hypothetical protein
MTYELEIVRSQNAGGAYTFATLPTAAQMATYALGVLAFTSDAGLCLWNGNNWQQSASASVTANVSPSQTRAANSTALQGAVASAAAAGGGVVFIPAFASPIPISTPVAPASGVAIVGAMPQLNYITNSATIPDSNAVLTNGAGTVLDCNAGAGFQWNKTALGVWATPTGFVQAGLTNFAIRNIGFSNYSRAIDAGNTNNPAGWYAEFENLYMSSGTDWGFWITNFQHCKFRRIYAFSNTTGQQYYGNDVPSTTLQPGNSVWEDLYAVTPSTNTNLSRGVVWFIQQGQQNEGLINRVQSNRLNATVVTQAATMTNTSANIGVTDVSRFPVNTPVTFSATQNGFFINEIYFVVSNPGGSGAGNITISLTVGGTAVAATGSTAVNIITQGFAAVEVVALSGAAISSHDFNNVDVEGGGTCAIIAQNVQTSKIEISQVPSAVQTTQSLCARALQFSTVFSRASINTSWDGNSGSSHLYGNRSAGSVGGGAVAHNPPGIYYDAGLGYTVMNLTASVYGLSDQTPDTSNLIIPISGIGERMNPKATQAVSPNCADTGLVSFTFTSGVVTVTLPTLSSTIFGCRYIFVNPTANTATVNTGTGQGFNNPAGRASVTLAQGTSIEVVGTHDANGSYWTVKGIGGVYAAGAITAF